MPVKAGWKGRVYEDFEVGDVYEHPLGRTILAADNSWFTLLTMNTNPIHFDAHYAAATEFQKPLVNSCLTLAIVTGQSVTDLSQNAAANLAWDEIRLPNPVFEGDTIYAKSEIGCARERRSWLRSPGSRASAGSVGRSHSHQGARPQECSSHEGRNHSCGCGAVYGWQQGSRAGLNSMTSTRVPSGS